MTKMKLNRRLGGAGLAVVGFVSSAPYAAAFNPPYAWFGEMVVLSAVGCGNRIVRGDAPTIVFRPKLQAGEPNSALSYLFGHSSGIVTKQATAPQLNGSGAATMRFVSGRATQETAAGSFNLTVAPAAVAPSTNFITFTGTLNGFAGLVGCNVTVRGAAAQRL